MGGLDQEARMLFGPSPAPAVRVPLEAIPVRLRAFAAVQAAEREAGWRIVDVERRLGTKDGFCIGPLPVSAKIDRVDEHPEWGLRVLDYKTSARAAAPDKTHWRGIRGKPWLPESGIAVAGKSSVWTDLQLPVYRLIAEHWYGAREVATGYFNLPADPASAGIQRLVLSQELLESARLCAEAIAGRVARGCFWPPQSLRASGEDPLDPILSLGTPDETLDAETVSFLGGQP
jgi:hypothetical protein